MYPLGGLIASGLGDAHKDPSFTEDYLDNEDLGYETISVEAKDATMFPPGTAPAEMFEQSQWLNTPTPRSATALFKRVYLSVWKETYAVHVKIPVMFALVRIMLQTCAGAFRNSPRVDTRRSALQGDKLLVSGVVCPGLRVRDGVCCLCSLVLWADQRAVRSEKRNGIT